jgi:DNA-binding transcriptional LysR family regulator
MNKIDYLGLDGHTLRTFLVVLEEMSVSRAAERLGVTQSAVSHTLDKLRGVFDDPLFVRIGRGIEPTARARELRTSVEAVLDDLKSLTHYREFDPLVEQMEFTIATNDFPLQLIFPKLLKEMYEQGIDLRIRFIPSGIPSVSILRASRYRMLITPTPPDDADLEKVSLIQSKMEIFYDSTVRKPPKTWEQFAESKYVDVRFSDTEASIMALPSIDTSKMNPPTISVPNFSSLAPMIKGTDRITSQLGVMKLGLLKELDSVPLPFKTDTLDLFLIWHRRENDDPAHQWLRQKILETVNSILENKEQR